MFDTDWTRQVESNRKPKVCLRERSQKLTCRNWAHQHSAELDDGTEDVFGVSSTCEVLTVTPENKTLILLLQQHQDVLQQ